jgi:hypothetical protein
VPWHAKPEREVKSSAARALRVRGTAKPKCASPLASTTVQPATYSLDATPFVACSGDGGRFEIWAMNLLSAVGAKLRLGSVGHRLRPPWQPDEHMPHRDHLFGEMTAEFGVQ